VVLAPASCSSRFGAPDPASTQAEDVVDLWRLFVVASIVVYAIVGGLILWAVVRYRRSRAGDPATFREHVPLEIVYTAVPVLIVVGLFLATFGTERFVDSVSKDPDLVVEVTAFDWSWRFAYPDAGVVITGVPGERPTLVLPQGRTVQISLRSTDVIHSFYVPVLLFKRDAVPGRTTEFEFVPTRLGTFFGQCGEYCGLDHSRMLFAIRVVPASEFDSWLAQQGTEAA
jgi:cytochrome c oxidase subunit II